MIDLEEEEITKLLSEANERNKEQDEKMSMQGDMWKNNERERE